MAEFIEVMEQAKRMCEAFNDGHCSECPIGNAKVLECGITVTSEMDCEEVERRVMQWSDAHPEHAYPTWNEWYRQNFPDAYNNSKRICPMVFGDGKNCYRETDCNRCRNNRIPADIADKLEIKPIAEKEQETVHNGCFRCKHILKSLFEDPCAKCRGWTKVVSGSQHGKLWEEG